MAPAGRGPGACLFSGALQADLISGVLGLRLGEPVAGARRELLDQAGPAEPAQLHVALGGIDGLCVPVGVQVVNGVFGLRLGEPGAGTGSELVEESLLAEPRAQAE